MPCHAVLAGRPCCICVGSVPFLLHSALATRQFNSSYKDQHLQLGRLMQCQLPTWHYYHGHQHWLGSSTSTFLCRSAAPAVHTQSSTPTPFSVAPVLCSLLLPAWSQTGSAWMAAAGRLTGPAMRISRCEWGALLGKGVGRLGVWLPLLFGDSSAVAWRVSTHGCCMEGSRIHIPFWIGRW